MNITDPIADLLTRIRNAIQARHPSVAVPSSRLKEGIVKILAREGFISSYVMEEIQPQGVIKIILKYKGKNRSVIHHIGRISRPGGRIYQGYQNLKGGNRIGLRILSTPCGLLTDREAFKARVGGEVLCEVW